MALGRCTETSARSHGSLGTCQYAPRAIETFLGFLVVCALVAASAFFVAGEFAIVAVDRERVERDAAAGGRRAGVTAAILRRLSFHLSAAQVGITVTSLVLGFVASPVFEELLDPLLGDALGRGGSIALALGIATLFQMLMGELVPKGFAVSRPLRTAYVLARPMHAYALVSGPVVRMLNGAANWGVRRLGIEPQEELRSVHSLEEIALLIRSSGEEGTLDPAALTLLTRTIRFGEKTAANALIPRLDVEYLVATDTLSTLTRRAAETGYSRFPVCGADLDDVHGTVHVKDVYRMPFDDRGSTPVTEVMRAPLVVPETTELADLLVELRRTGIHLAVVVDEYGGTAGIITLEDVLEEIVGEIDDEHDRPAPRLTQVQRPGEWVVDGSLHHDEVYDACGFDMPDGPYETLAGFVLERLGHIPDVGERVELGGWVLTVEAMDRRRIASVRLLAPAAP